MPGVSQVVPPVQGQLSAMRYHRHSFEHTDHLAPAGACGQLCSLAAALPALRHPPPSQPDRLT
jgi:hypothetical protein